MKAAELRELDFSDLVDRLVEARAELFNLRFQLATNQLENTAQLRATKKEIARIATLIREQELAEWRSQKSEVRDEASEGATS